MSDENNKRYIGEVFIDGKSDRLLQEFLTNLFNSYNGPGKGFNADMVDNWHLDEILKYVDDGLTTKMDSFTIGNTVFTVYESSKFLQLTDIIYNEFKSEEEAPWVSKLKNDKSGEKYQRQSSTLFESEADYLASDILLDIYYTLEIDKYDKEDFADFYENEFDPLSVDHHNLRDEFTEFKRPFENILRDVEIIDIDGNVKTIKMLDAQLINGFQIIPITQAAYDALPTKQKEYWRYIYIIVDEVPDDYINPITFDLFKDVKLVYNPETQYIDYYDGISERPRPLISLAELVEKINFTQQFSEFLSETNNYTINPTALKESIKELIIQAADLPELPFVAKDEAVVLASEITSQYGTITSQQNSNNFNTFNISHAFDTKFNEITNRFSQMETTIGITNADTRSYVDSNFLKKGDFAPINQKINNDIVATKQQLISRITALEDKYYKNSLEIKVGRSYDSAGENFKSLVVRQGQGIYVKLYWDNPNVPASYLANRQLYLEIHGKYYIRTTNTNGKTSDLIINLDPGIYLLHVFLGSVPDKDDPDMHNSTHTVKIIEVEK